jgi:excisionase family DNA binding protein
VPPHVRPDPSPPPFGGRLTVSINEAAEALSVVRDSIHRMINDGRLAASKVGRKTVVHSASIHQLLQATLIAPKAHVAQAPPEPEGLEVKPQPPRKVAKRRKAKKTREPRP